MTIQELARRIGAELRGDGARDVSGCAGLEYATEDDVSFLANTRYYRHLATTRAAAVILSADAVERAGHITMLIADDPYFAFRQAMVTMYGFRENPPRSISNMAIIDPTATIGHACCMQPCVYIAANVKIGDRCIIYPHCYLGPNTVMGDDCILFPNVTVYNDCVLGDRVTLHAGCVIGQDGFGYATHQAKHHKIPQAGNVVIEDDVELGANCTVDRATVGSTHIGTGTKFSNLVAIGHGAKVGEHNLLVAMVGLAGSVRTGDYVVIGGQTAVGGHLKIGNHVQIAGQSGVMKDIPDHTPVGGMPAVPLNVARRNWLAWMRLGEYASQIQRMQKRMDELERRISQSDGPSQ